MANAYWVETQNWTTREKVSASFYRLNKEWAYSENKRGGITYWHTIPTSKKKEARIQYVTFERQRWHRAGDIRRDWPNSSKPRKSCMQCKKRIPVPIRVMFELRGK